MATPKTRRQLLSHHVTTDASRLSRLLALERMAVDAYSLALESAPLGPAAADAAKAILAQEQLHVEALERFVPTPPLLAAPRTEVLSDRSVARELARAGIHVRFQHVRNEHDWVQLLERIEGALAGAHFRAVRELGDAAAARVSAAILADEAQHATVLTRLRHPRDIARAVPYSVVPADALLEL